MELASFAEQILFGTTLEDKLLDPGSVTDRFLLPAMSEVRRPGRPQELRFVEDHESSKAEVAHRQSFPGVHLLDRASERARVLHFFANHELLALELMALVLLKFPDAPKAFRRGLCGTMRDEQKHLRLYIAHMERLGLNFGSLPLNNYFWKTLSGVSSPFDFVTKMSLTFEQANLDFAAHFKEVFLRVGDLQSAGVMEEVFLDEIRHVRHGLEWFRRWKDPAVSDWEAFEANLEFPLSPSRAKGAPFDVGSRKSCGFGEDFISRLQIFNRSKGRPPQIWVYNPSQEFEVGAPGLSYTQTSVLHEIGSDLELLLLVLAAPSDVLALRRPVDVVWAKELARLGFTVPDQVAYDDHARRIMWPRERSFSRLVPWGWSPQMRRLEAALAGGVEDRVAGGVVQGAFKELVSKSFGAGLRCEVSSLVLSGLDQGELCVSEMRQDNAAGAVAVVRDLDEALAAARWMMSLGVGMVVFKSCFASSGHGQMRITPGGPTQIELSWLRKVLAVHGECVVEPWRKIEIEVSAQCEVSAEGDVRCLGMVRNVSSKSGQYLASVAGKYLWHDATDVRSFLHGSGFLVQLEESAVLVGRELHGKGYSGPFGVDAYVFRHPDGSLDKNLLGEVNLRHTMGRIALGLAKRCLAGRSVVLALVPIEEKGLVEVRLKALGLVPGTVLHAPSFGQKALGAVIDKGCFYLADPSQAKRVLPLVWVGDVAMGQCFMSAIY
jgi:uncharacterized ferritin-like protein (DUF455 family)